MIAIIVGIILVCLGVALILIKKKAKAVDSGSTSNLTDEA